MKLYMLDNRDSFVYNLAAYVRQEGADIEVQSIDDADFDGMRADDYDGMILSPGPGKPENASKSIELLKRFAGKCPILGVCLGHQVIAYYFGGQVIKGEKPMHGKLTRLYHNGNGLFQGIPNASLVTRYHSLVVKKSSLPDVFRIDGSAEQGEIMAISHRTLPIYGVQFHPEAVLTEYGHNIIQNFIKICKEQRKET